LPLKRPTTQILTSKVFRRRGHSRNSQKLGLILR